MIEQSEERKQYLRSLYYNNREARIQQVHARRKLISEFVYNYKAERGCSQCTETHPACLDFHHIDPSQKEIALYMAIRNGWGLKRIQAEIEKCVILCANCHRKEHAGDIAG